MIGVNCIEYPPVSSCYVDEGLARVTLGQKKRVEWGGGSYRLQPLSDVIRSNDWAEATTCGIRETTTYCCYYTNKVCIRNCVDATVIFRIDWELSESSNFRGALLFLPFALNLLWCCVTEFPPLCVLLFYFCLSWLAYCLLREKFFGNTLYHCYFPSDVNDRGHRAARGKAQGEARARRGGTRGRALGAIPYPRSTGTYREGD